MKAKKNSKRSITEIQGSSQRVAVACLASTCLVAMSAASISCSAETRDWVKAYMRRHGLPTYDDALRHMKGALEGQDHDGVARAAAPQAPHDAEQPAKKQKLEQLISWTNFVEHDEILTYLTGLGKAEREWLVPRLEKAVWVRVGLSSRVFRVLWGF